MFNITKVVLELISDANMYLSFGKDMRVGVSHISKRYSKVKNKYWKSYDLKQESKHIMHVEMNNLYGYTMSNFLLTGGFKWIDPK